MAWWPRRKRGKHAMAPATGHPNVAAMERVAEDLRETINRRPEIDRLAKRVRREFGVR